MCEGGVAGEGGVADLTQAVGEGFSAARQSARHRQRSVTRHLGIMPIHTVAIARNQVTNVFWLDI